MAMKVCLMSTYFKERMPNYLRWYCEELLTYFDRVILLIFESLCDEDIEFLDSVNSNANNQKTAHERLVPYVLRENSGFDFGAWYRGLDYLDGCKHIGFVNDSCIPFRSFKKFFEWFDSGRCTYAGFTNNMEFNYHIQTYFVVARGEETIQAIRKFFSDRGIIHDKFQVIKKYEIGLSQYLIDNGFKIAAMYDCKDGKINWTMKKPMELMKQGFPFVKKKLGISHFTSLMKEIASACCENINVEYIIEGVQKDGLWPDKV